MLDLGTYRAYTSTMRTAIVFITYIGLLVASTTGHLLLGAVFIGLGAYAALSAPRG